MPKAYWYWAMKYASRIQNIFPIKYNNKYTTPHELVFKDKLDYRQLLRLFSTVYFLHSKDNTKLRTNIQAHSLAGIAVGWSEQANGLLVYNPITKELYTTSTYKLDEHNATQQYFNLKYDGGMFSGLYSNDSRQNLPEPYPIGIAVTIPSESTTSPGYVLAVPSNTDPAIDSMYTIQLLDSKTTIVPESSMPNLVKKQSPDIKITLPPWMAHEAKVHYTVDRITH